uniref:Uncharacterized protein LOC105852352 n=1 Tax=Cicer arietinum TaxID=3827 RepID=A0A1S3ED27_CICAR|nr:uncharacterized protein LOC105852352 [Cicer arietinum]
MNTGSNDEKKNIQQIETTNDREQSGETNEGTDSPELVIVIPRFVMEEDELEGFKTPTGPEYQIPPPLVCPSAPKRKPRPKSPSIEQTSPLFQVPTPEEVDLFFQSLIEQYLARINIKKNKND